MENIKIQLNNSLEIGIKPEGFHIIRCDGLISFEVLHSPEALKKSILFYSFPSNLDGFGHIRANEIFDLKIKTGNNMGTIVTSSIEEKYQNGFNYFFVNPAGIDPSGIEYILDYMEQKFQSCAGKISFVLFLDHVSYHSYFEDDSIIFSSPGKRKPVFKIKL